MGILDVPPLSTTAVDSRIDARVARAVADGLSHPETALLPSVKLAANRAVKFILNSQWPTVYPGTSPITNWGGVTEHYIRPAANSVYAAATVLGKGQYDATVTGVSEADARTATLRIINSLASTHLANGGTWGGAALMHPLHYDWQQGYWASMVALAARALWSSLTSTQQNAVKAMVLWEAGRVVFWPFWQTWKDRAGTENFVGDSKSEEVAWSSTILILAIIFDPTSSIIRDYKATLARMMVYQNARPVDLSDNSSVNGIIPATFLWGTNMTDDGIIVNHGRIHPDYEVSAGASNYLALAAAADEGVTIPGSVGRNAEVIYKGLTSVVFTPGTIPSQYPAGGAAIEPGGSIYPWPAKSTTYAPQSNDWGGHRVAPALTFDVLAYKYGWDRGLNPGAAFWASLHVTEALAMQDRFTTGQTYITGDWSEDSYGQAENNPWSREAYIAVCLAGALHTLTSTTPPRVSTSLILPGTVGSWSSTVTASSPRVWWRLGEAATANVSDSSGAGNSGGVADAISGGAAMSWQQPSLVPTDSGNLAIKVNGGTRIRTNNDAPTVFPGNPARSFAMAFKRDVALPSAAEWIIGQWNAAGSATTRLGGFRIQTNGHLAVEMYRTDGSSSLVETSVSVCDGLTHFVVLTISAGGAVAYLDGVPVLQVHRNNPNLGSTDRFAVGGTSDSSGRASGLVIDEVLVWNRFLAEHEVIDLYKAFTG